jgi:hypothetical protein
VERRAATNDLMLRNEGRKSGTRHGITGPVLIVEVSRALIGRLDLPVLEIDRRASAEELDNRHEPVTPVSPDDGPDEPPKRTVQDPDMIPDQEVGLGRDRPPGVEHEVDSAKIALKSDLIPDLEHIREMVSLDRLGAIAIVAMEKHVARKEGDR